MPLLRILLLSFLLVPLLELYLLVKVGGVIGAWPTVALVVFTAVTGALLLRQQGLATVRRVQAMLQRGEVPSIELLEGLVLLVCGALLLTPGFFTDLIALAGLVRPLRRLLIRSFLARSIVHVTTDRPRERGPHTIDGEFRRHDD